MLELKHPLPPHHDAIPCFGFTAWPDRGSTFLEEIRSKRAQDSLDYVRSKRKLNKAPAANQPKAPKAVKTRAKVDKVLATLDPAIAELLRLGLT